MSRWPALVWLEESITTVGVMLRLRTRIFVDFWNFQLNWNDRLAPARCDWQALPSVLVEESSKLLPKAGLADDLALDETLVYASVKPGEAEEKLKGWLTAFLDRQPSFRVKLRDRRVRSTSIRCNSCRAEIAACPHCHAGFERSPEKGIDTAIATDLLSLSWEGVLDVAVLVSGDADFVPAVERIQEKGIKVVNATWRRHGHDLAHSCWASFELDAVVERLLRE